MQQQNIINRNIIALKRLSRFGKRKVSKILNNIPDGESLDLFSILSEGIKLGVLSKNQTIGSVVEARDYAERVISLCQKEDISIVNIFDPDFPKALLFRDHPYLVYYKGDLSCLDNPNRATVVGTRHPNKNGKDFAYHVAELLVKHDYTVISGLAQGCDTAAHRAALDNHGKTVAFIPSTINHIAPRENQKLADEIVASGGLIITEYSPLSTPNSAMYVTRDRLQAGSTNMIFVSEFDEQSGTLQTLEFGIGFKKSIYTLSNIVNEPEFNGFSVLFEKKVDFHALDWKEIENVIVQRRIG